MAVEKVAGSKLSQSFGALKVRGFRYLFLSNVSINFAQWFQSIGLGWLVFELTGSATQMGAITGTQGIFLLLASPVAGILSDRMNRRKLLMIATAINAVQALTLAILVGSGLAQIWHLYAYAIIGGIANAVSQPVRQAFLYDIVGREGIARAVPLNQFAFSGARVIGPAIAGAVIGFTGTSNVFYIQGILAVIAMVLTVIIGPTEHAVAANKGESPLESIGAGLRYAVNTPAIFGQLFTQTILTLLVYPYVQFLAFFAAQMNGGPQGYGILATGAGYGGILGLMFMTMVVGEVKKKGMVLLIAQTAYPCAVALFSLTHTIPTAMVFLILAGFCNSFIMAMQNTLLLMNTRSDMRGRVMSLYTMMGGLGPVGQFGLGLAITQWGPNTAVLGFTLTAVVLMAIAMLCFPAVRKA